MYRDVYVTLIIDEQDFSEIIREIVEYAIDLVEKKYGLKIRYRRIFSSEIDYPILIVNDMEPITIDEIPSMETLVDLMLMVSDVMKIGLINNGLSHIIDLEF